MAAAKSVFPPMLCEGASGKSVALLQLYLNGTMVPSAQGLIVDGVFGPTTAACVAEHCAALGLPEGSVVDTAFLAAIKMRSGADLATITCNQMMRGGTYFTGPGFENRPKSWRNGGQKRGLAFPPYLNQGSGGRAVTLWQVFLAGAGHGEGIVFDDDYGSITAVRTGYLQKSFGLHPDGHCGPDTRAAVFGRYGLDLNRLPVRPFCANTLWCRSVGEALDFHPHRGPHDRRISMQSRLTLGRAGVIVERAPEASQSGL